MKPNIIFLLVSIAWFASSCKTSEDTQFEVIAEKRAKIEAVAAKYAQLNTADIFNWNGLSAMLEQQNVVERFDISKYELCLENWVEFSRMHKELWQDCDCEALHSERLAILKAPEQTPGSNWPLFQKHREEHKSAFEKCATNKEILDKKKLELSQPCTELQAIINR